MAGMGPPPKDPKLRQRRNKTSTAATLTIVGDGEANPAAIKPDLPKRGKNETPWHERTVEFWRTVWASPMAAEYLLADVPRLVMLAELVEAFYRGDKSLAAEIRLQGQCFGLTPLDRRRLQWEVEKVSEAQQRAQRRQSNAAAVETPTGVRDPRRNLRAVK